MQTYKKYFDSKLNLTESWTPTML